MKRFSEQRATTRPFKTDVCTFVDTDVLVGELRDPSPGEPGDPGEPGFNEADDGGLDRLLLVEPEKASLKLGFCRPDRVDFPSTSLSSGSFTGGGAKMNRRVTQQVAAAPNICT